MLLHRTSAVAAQQGEWVDAYLGVREVMEKE